MGPGQHRRRKGKEMVEHHKQRGREYMIKGLADQGLGVATAYNKVAKEKLCGENKLIHQQGIDVSRNDQQARYGESDLVTLW